MTTRPEVAGPSRERLLDCARRAGANVIVTACPLCQINLEAYQGRIAPARRHPPIPVLLHPAPRPGAGLDPKRLDLAPLPGARGRRCRPSAEGPDDERRRTEARIGVYICHCGSNIASNGGRRRRWPVHAATLPNVAVSRDYKFMCSDPGQELIQQDIREHGLNRVVVAACSPLMHEPTFRSGLRGGRPEPLPVPDGQHPGALCRGSPTTATAATRKAKRCSSRRPSAAWRCTSRSSASTVPVNPDVLIVGGGIAGIQAALDARRAGQAGLPGRARATIGGHMARFDKTFPTLDCAACILTPKMVSVATARTSTSSPEPRSRRSRASSATSRSGSGGAPATSRTSCTSCQECEKVCPVGAEPVRRVSSGGRPSTRLSPRRSRTPTRSTSRNARRAGRPVPSARRPPATWR